MGRTGVAAALPNAKGRCETSVPLLLPLGGPKENEGAVGGAVTGDVPKENAAFSAAAGGVAGAAPNENGLSEDGRGSTELARWPNKKPPLVSVAN